MCLNRITYAKAKKFPQISFKLVISYKLIIDEMIYLLFKVTQGDVYVIFFFTCM